jgi:hypothetical protein
MKKNPKRAAGDPFPYLPAPDIPAHPPFDLILEWSALPRVDTWKLATPTPHIPVNNGIWKIEDITPDYRPYHLGVKTTGAIEFLSLRRYSDYLFTDKWPNAPIEKGMAGTGFYDHLALPGGQMNGPFKWECTDVN